METVTGNRFWTDPDGRVWRVRLERSQALKGTRRQGHVGYILAWVSPPEMKFLVPLPGPIDVDGLTDEQLEEIQAARSWHGPAVS